MSPSLVLVLLLAAPALMIPSTSLQVGGQRTAREAKDDSIKVLISEGFLTQGDSADVGQGGKEINLIPGSPLVLTHKIKLVPSGSRSGSCGCEADFAALRERLERLEREVSSLREKCGGAEGGCCTSKESKGAGCTIKPETAECPNECSDQGRCVDAACVCFPGFSGPDCSRSNCPGNCNSRGRCVDGKCMCDPGFTGPDCSKKTCPSNCNDRGRCVNGKCVCNDGFTGADCSENSCPGNCNSRGRCVDGQCVCNPGFTKPDCSQRSCPDDCNSRGRCINGQCVCDHGFAGPSCSDHSCPGNCNSRGRCVNGQCVCNPGFTSPDCSKKACPGNCNDRGRCMNGKCVCDGGFTGLDCSEKSCPGNCNSRGRCVDGECVCNDGFTGADCSERTCPNDCSDRGRCVDGKCSCDAGFTGDDCSAASCPGNCNSRGRCVDGQCVCDNGFTGGDCSGKACPRNCGGRGKCVNGKCVCNAGFAGPECGGKACPGNCSNKGRCVKGRCVCRRGFTGPDCSKCEDGVTGPNCDTVMSGVSQLTTRGITESSVTLLWTAPPRVQYDTYFITFSSQKDSDQQISVQVEGSLTSYTQTGLASAQDYTASITGGIGGRKGAESAAEFTTLISPPTDLRAAKATSTSAVVHWEQSQGEIDRYRLTVTPHDGAGNAQEVTVPAGQTYTHIQQLEAGRAYDITLVAEKGSGRSEPATTRVTPDMSSSGLLAIAAYDMTTLTVNPNPFASLGKSLPMFTMADMTLAPGQDVGDRHQEFKPSAELQVFDQQGRREDGTEADSVNVGGIDGPNKDSTTSLIAKTKPLVSSKMGINGTSPKVAERPTLYRKPNVSGPFRFNTTRVVAGRKRFGSGPLQKPPVGQKKKAPIVPKRPKPGVPTIEDRTIALTMDDLEASSTERGHDKNPAKMSGTDSDPNRQRSSEEPTVAISSKEQPDVGMAGQGNNTAPVSSEPTGTVQSQEKKCMNKVKVTHVRFPHRGKASGCRGDGTGSDQGSSETDDVKPSSEETDLDYSPDPLNKLLTDTFDGMNITSFSLYLSKPSDPSVISKHTVRKPIASGQKPLLPSSRSSSSSQASSRSSLQSSSSLASLSLVSSTAAPSHPPVDPSSSPSSTTPSASPSLTPSSSTAAPSHSSSSLPSSTSSSAPPSLAPSSSTSTSSSASHSLVSSSSHELDVDNGKSATDVASPEARKLPPSGKGVVPIFQRTPANSGYVRHLRPNPGSFQNKTRLNLRVPHQSSPRLNLVPRREKETRRIATELSSLPSLSASSVELNLPARETNGDKDGATSSSGVEQTQKKMPTERGRIPVRRLPPKAGHMIRRPNFGPLQNRTRPNLRLLAPPSRPSNPASEMRKEHVTSTELPATSSSSPASKESDPAEGPTAAENGDGVGPGMSSTSMETLRGSGVPSSHQPTTKVGYFRGPQMYGGRFHNNTRTNLRPPQHPRRGPMQKLIPNRKLNGGSVVGGQIRPLVKNRTVEIPDNQSGEQDAPVPTQGVQIHQSAEQTTVEVIPSAQMGGHDPTIRPQINEIEVLDSATIQIYGGRFHNNTRTNLRPPQHPRRGPMQKLIPTGKLNGGSVVGGHIRPLVKDRTDEIPDNQSGEQDALMPTQGVQIRQSAEQATVEVIPSGQMDGHDPTVRPQINELEVLDSATIQTTKSGEEETSAQDSKSDAHKERANSGTSGGATSRGRPTIKQTTSDSRHRAPRPVTIPKKQPPTRSKTLQHQIRHYNVGSKRRPDTKTKNTTKRLFDSKPSQSRNVDSKPQTGSGVSSSGVTREPLDHVGVTNRTSDGFTLTWDSLEEKYKSFVVTSKDVGKYEGPKQKESKKEQQEQEDSEKEGRDEEEEATRRPSEGTESGNGSSEDKNRVPESVPMQGPRIQSSMKAKPVTGSGEIFKKVLPASARSFQFENLPPLTEYTVTLLGKGPGLLSRLHKLVISTGPEPPTDIVFSELTENSLTVSWTKPKTAISGFKVTYTNTDDGEPVSVSVGSDGSDLGLSRLSPGSSYEVSVVSVAGLEESDPVKDFVMTLPDPPTDLRVLNVTDTKALLLWRPALAAVDKYTIVYGSGTDSEVRVVVSGNAAEQQLSGLEGSTTYTVSISSQLGSAASSTAATSFTTATDPVGDGNSPRDLQANRVTPRTALLSWKPPSNPASSYRLTYQTEGQEMKEVTVDATATEYNLTRLHPGSTYLVQLQAETGGQYSTAISTHFTAGTLRFPFPTDCSEELMNGIRVSGEVEIFPRGKLGTPMTVYCDMETAGGGWTVFQRRKDGSVDFFRGWKDYTRGFGDLSGEFWLGLESLYNLTAMTTMTLRVDLRDGAEAAFAEYSTFQLLQRNYKLVVGGYSGTAGDSLSYHNQRIFSTRDRDLSPFITRCAMSYRGGWWYKNCHEANLNGVYGSDVNHQGIIWTTWRGKQFSIPFAEMKMRPTAFRPSSRG